MNVMPVELYSDGACSGNPGPGGAAYVIRYWELPEGGDLPQVQQIEKSTGFKLTTNNRMEILAAINGLTEILNNVKSGVFKNVSVIILRTDSEYFCNAVNKRWIDSWQRNNWVTSTQTPVKNRELWENLLNVIGGLRGVGVTLNIEHIPGHSGHEFNELADKLAVTSSKDSTNQISDEIYEKQSKR